MPQYDLEWLGIGFGHYGMRKSAAAVREGSGKPLPWPFGPHVAG